MQLIEPFQKTNTDSKTGKKTIRKDYDLALIRLDYPIADPDTGMTVLQGAKFSAQTIMPICLPSSTKFKDTDRSAIAVGMGISAER